MPARNLPLDADRLWNDIMALAAITDPERPYTRRSFTPLFLEGRAWIAERFREAGLDVRIDTGGNLIGRREGRDPARGVLMVGSHSDTVPAGGRFDGIAGLITALEIVRALDEAGEQLEHTIEVVDFLAEEPSDFGVSCVGSRAAAGVLTPAMLDLTGPGGERLGDALRRVGGDPEALAAAKRDDVRAFLELHIEQGPVLERGGIDIGIVTSIVGIRRIEIVFEGAADHAGTTPMDVRRDALVAGAATVVGRAADGRRAGGGARQNVHRNRRHIRDRARRVERRARPLPPDGRHPLDRSRPHRAVYPNAGPSLCQRRGRRAGFACGIPRIVQQRAGTMRSDFARRAPSRRQRARPDNDRSRQRCRARCRIHGARMPLRHGLRRLQGRQEPRSRGMGGPRRYRRRRRSHAASVTPA